MKYSKEFKENRFEPHVIGEYISALSNSAVIAGKDEGFLVWGISNKGHKIIENKRDGVYYCHKRDTVEGWHYYCNILPRPFYFRIQKK